MSALDNWDEFDKKLDILFGEESGDKVGDYQDVQLEVDGFVVSNGTTMGEYVQMEWNVQHGVARWFLHDDGMMEYVPF